MLVLPLKYPFLSPWLMLSGHRFIMLMNIIYGNTMLIIYGFIPCLPMVIISHL